MAPIKHVLIILLLLSACSSTTSEQKTNSIGIKQPAKAESSNEIPADGKYIFDVAYAEHQGASMGKEVTVIISGDAIKIVLEGIEIDNGTLLKHKSGKWIIATNKTDSELEEVGGCTDGPSTIDFKNKKYWMC